MSDVKMVDVGDKPESEREATAACRLLCEPATRDRLLTGAVKKGDAVGAARIAGILAAKRVPELIPLCHPLPLTAIDVEFIRRRRGYGIVGRVAVVGRTGVEMEALVAVSVAALTLYDMVKALDRTMVIGPIRLREKRGGRSGVYRRGRTGRS